MNIGWNIAKNLCLELNASFSFLNHSHVMHICSYLVTNLPKMEVDPENLKNVLIYESYKSSIRIEIDEVFIEKYAKYLPRHGQIWQSWCYCVQVTSGVNIQGNIQANIWWFAVILHKPSHWSLCMLSSMLYVLHYANITNGKVS